ncbi:MAG: hypothetical protein GF363_11610 [Chitinivibrionales bacterium]|nr:hypothetical protein [Chitinivibrionales bacterium]
MATRGKVYFESRPDLAPKPGDRVRRGERGGGHGEPGMSSLDYEIW